MTFNDCEGTWHIIVQIILNTRLNFLILEFTTTKYAVSVLIYVAYLE